jgi:hypothetical protein
VTGRYSATRTDECVLSHDLRVDDRSAQEAYLARVRRLRISLGDALPVEAPTEVDSLIEHGEPAVGVCSLAWALHNGHVAVRGWMNVAIRDLTHCLVDPAHMPPHLPETVD